MWKVVKIWEDNGNVFYKMWNCDSRDAVSLRSKLSDVLEDMFDKGWEPFSVDAGQFYLKKSA